MIEFNVIVETPDFRESDVELFFGEKEPPNLIRVKPETDMWELLATLKLFPSKSQARKDPKWGAMMDIPNGWTEFQFGKKKRPVFILNFV